jgi:hypothetical protein
VVTAVLPNGRRSRMRIIPTLAPIKEVNRLRSVVMVNERRQAIATSRNSRAIKQLAVTQAAAVKRLTASQVKSDKDLGKRIVEGHNRLDARITKELGNGAGTTGKHGKRMMMLLRRQRQRSIMNSVTIASSLPFWVAYGKQDDPFARDNLILAGSLIGWLIGDELIDQFSGKSSLAQTGATWWSWLAPIGNGATVYFLLKDRQHERYIGGISTIEAPLGHVIVKLEDVIGKDSFSDFKGKSHSVVATLLEDKSGVVSAISGSTTVTGTVKLSIASAVIDGTGQLTITLNGVLSGTDKAKVAWIVDTSESEALEPSK